MSSVQIQRLQWLMEVISDYEPITFKEIQGKWDKCSLNCDCKPYAERTFRDHLKDIYDSFGISIKCNNYNEYYIDREESHSTTGWPRRSSSNAKSRAKNLKTIREKLQLRQAKMNETFVWTEENVRRLLELNDTLAKLMDEARKKHDEVERDIKFLCASGKTNYINSDIETYIYYDFYVDEENTLGNELVDFAYEKLKTSWNTRPDMDKDPLNEWSWNIDELCQPSFNDHRICYLMYVFFSKCCMPFQYGLLLDPKRFIVQTEVHV